MKILIIRFSSIGDLTQALSIPAFLKNTNSETEIHFVTRKDLAQLADNNPNIKKVWSLDKKLGFAGLLQLISNLRKENFSHIYDAHNNLRSFFIRGIIWGPKKLVRPMYRWKRFLLLQFHINLFEQPFSGQRDLIKPLEKWNLKFALPEAPQIFLNSDALKSAQAVLDENQISKYFVLVPSATYQLKRWPISHWKKLVELNPEKKFIVLAGAEDIFTDDLNAFKNVLNLTGKTTLLQSAAFIQLSNAVISNDTGLLHIAEQLGRPAIALMGPAPFGFPSRKTTFIFEKKLKCRPCSKHGQGPCVNSIYQECLQSITPDAVSKKLQEMLQ